MNKKLWIKAALLTLVAVLIVPAALAGHKTRVAVRAPYMQALAYELREQTREARAEAAFRARTPFAHRGPVRVDGRVVGMLADLERQADRFLVAVESRNPRRVEREYVRLVRDFDRASFGMERVRSPQVRREFRDVVFAMRRVAQRIELAAGHGPGHPRYDRLPDGVHGTVIFGDVLGNADLRIRVDW